MRCALEAHARFLVFPHRIPILCGLVLWGILLAGRETVAQERDTLSFCRPENGYVFFRNPDVVLQAARFVNPAPGYLREISVALGGNSDNGTARLRLFGHEGGVPAPILEEDLIEPILLRKSKPGFERVIVPVPGELFIENNQFFVAIDRIDSGVVWLSDRVEKTPFCSSSDDLFYYQLLKQNDGGWRWEKFGYAVDVVMDYPAVMPSMPMGDVAAGLGIVDTVRFNRSIAWADVDSDNYLDLLWDGRLYLNREGERFERIDEDAGLAGSPKANAFLDANNDGHLDILFIGSHDTTDRQSRLFLGSGDLTFTRIDLEITLPDDPTSFSIADVDGDGRLDLFIGGACDSGGCVSRLLLNTGGTGFRDAPDRIALPGVYQGLSSSGSQLIDLDRDDDPDLYIARRYPERSLLLYNDGTGRFSTKTPSSPLHELGAGSGGDWKDFDNDGDPDLLYPRLIHPYLRRYRDADGSGIYLNGDGSEGAFARMNGAGASDAIAYEERHTGGAWGDVNNDGLLDAFFTTAGDCRFAELYEQSPDHSFTLNTFDYGLHWSSAGEDAVWVDYDNDGRLDLCAVEWGRLRLYRNPGDGKGDHFVEIDAVGTNGAHDVGATVTIHAGGMTIGRDVTIGRGVLMEDPPRLHYGLGSEGKIDSIVARWSDGTNEVFTDVAIDEVHQLVKGSSGRNAAIAEATITAVPNPFSSELHIHYHIAKAGRIRLEIYDRSGDLVKVLIDEESQAGDHSAIWEGDDGSGKKVSSGVYIYRLVFGNGEVSGRAVYSQ